MSKTKSPLTSAPEDLPLTEKMAEFARKHGMDRDQAQWEVDQFLDKARAKGWQYADWTAAWRTWIRNVVRFKVERGVVTDNMATVHRKRLN